MITQPTAGISRDRSRPSFLNLPSLPSLELLALATHPSRHPALPGSVGPVVPAAGFLHFDFSSRNFAMAADAVAPLPPSPRPQPRPGRSLRHPRRHLSIHPFRNCDTLPGEILNSSAASWFEWPIPRKPINARSRSGRPPTNAGQSILNATWSGTRLPSLCCFLFGDD